MDVNPNNNKELMLSDYKIEYGDVLYFLTLVNNDGTVDIYLNIETYEVKIEFNN